MMNPGHGPYTKILRLWNGEIITGELGQNDLLEIIDYSTDNGRIGFRMMNSFSFRQPQEFISASPESRD